ncbi:MAG: hypothetical protein PHO03_01760 [Candidatus Omnitrophica bacterium]|nr:hypothetical protein [Candidatus Omnitrophota bacterium]
MEIKDETKRIFWVEEKGKLKLNWIEKLLDKYQLDLSGLTVFTELATRDYFLAGFIPALANAKKVYLYNEDLFCGSNDPGSFFSQIEKTNSKDKMAEADIITNTGFVRPITAQNVAMMKGTAIIALMMSKQQIRPSDIDISACLSKGIELVETDEINSGILDSMGFKLLKVLFDSGLSVWNDRYLLLSAGLWSGYYERMLNNNGISYSKSTFNHLKNFDAIIVANHDQVLNRDLLWIGADNDEQRSVISIDRILKENPLIKIINISGNIDHSTIFESGIDMYPNVKTKTGYSAVHGGYLGYKVVFEMMVASLKAAERAARDRLKQN